jgi:hypothetical protein
MPHTDLFLFGWGGGGVAELLLAVRPRCHDACKAWKFTFRGCTKVSVLYECFCVCNCAVDFFLIGISETIFLYFWLHVEYILGILVIIALILSLEHLIMYLHLTASP